MNISIITSSTTTPRSYHNLPPNSACTRPAKIGQSLHLSAMLNDHGCVQICANTIEEGQTLAHHYVLQQRHRYQHILRCSLQYAHSLADHIFDDQNFLEYLYNNRITSSLNSPSKRGLAVLRQLSGPNLLLLEQLKHPEALLDFKQVISPLVSTWSILAVTPPLLSLPGFQQLTIS